MPASPFDLSGRVIVVTGGAGGIGGGIVDGLVAAGARVAVWDLAGQALERAGARLDAQGAGIALACDVSDPTSVDAALATSIAKLGVVSGCFANAGIGGPRRKLIDYATEEWRTVLRINVEGTLISLRAVAAQMVASETAGALVVTSSLAARSGASGSAPYGASKGAVISLVQALAVELAPHDIRAHAILPGWIRTGMTDSALESAAMKQRVLPRIPMGRWGRPADFAGVAVYLMSDAAAYQTGGSFVVDGGYGLF